MHTIGFRPQPTHCPTCHLPLKVQKTHTRTVTTLHIGGFYAVETVLFCQRCESVHHSEELCRLVPPGSNFGYDVLVYAGKALHLRHRNEEEVVAELAARNVRISPSEVSLLSKKFIVYLAIAHGRCTENIKEAMRIKGGYICHLDATCEGREPILMSSLDSLSKIVLSNIKLPSEEEKKISPFLQHIKETFGIPLALVHDMGAGILKAVANVFPGVADFICHFHFLRDIGKDLMAEQYDIIRKRLSKHEITSKLRYRAKRLKRQIDQHPGMIEELEVGIENQLLSASSLQWFPLLNGYSLIHWALEGKNQGNGYGFPFDRPYLTFAERLRDINIHLNKLKEIQLRGERKDNEPYSKILVDLKRLINDKSLWRAVEQIEKKINVFDRLRKAMRIAPQSGRSGLNDEGGDCDIRSIEHRVKKFRVWLTSRKTFPQDHDAQKMIGQIDKYWEKLFADPITAQTPSGTILIQPQRTNNILEQFFRNFKRGNRRRTGNSSSSRMLRTMLAQTPLVKNLENPGYMKILLNGKATLEEVFAEIEIAILREEFRKAQLNPEKIPAKIKRLIALPDYPQELVNMLQKAGASSKSNRILW